MVYGVDIGILRSWLSTMDGFDADPINAATASLVCGAIAIDPAAPDRVYVGTGEGDTDGIFASRENTSVNTAMVASAIRSS